MGARLDVTTSNEPLPTMTVSGEIDHFNCARAENTVRRLLEGDATALVIDLTDAAYVDTAGVAMIFWTAKQLNDRGGELRLVVPPGDVRRILELAGIGSLPGTVVFAGRDEAYG